MFNSNFVERKMIAQLTAEMLLEIEAINFNVEEPFELTSGRLSPVYIDCRRIISYPRIRNTLMDFCVSILFQEVGFEKFDAVAGGETAGIPFAAWIAEKMGLPMQYVRKNPKGFGRNAQIEGAFEVGDRILLVEDLTTDGGSKIKFSNILRDAGATVEHAIVIFYYNIYAESERLLKAKNLKLHHLTSWREVLAVCKTKNYFDIKTLTAVEEFLDAPLDWSQKRLETE